MSTKAFVLFFVLCFAIGSLAQLSVNDQVAEYTYLSLPSSGTITSWTNTAPSTTGEGDLTALSATGNQTVTVSACGPIFTGASFDGLGGYFSGAFTPINVLSTESVVVIFVGRSGVNAAGQQGVITTSNDVGVVPFTEASVGPGIWHGGNQYYQDAESPTTTTVAGTMGLTQNAYVAAGFVYPPDSSVTTGDYVVVGNSGIQFFAGATSASVQTTGAFGVVNVGWRATGSFSSSQLFTGCISYLSIYVIPGTVDPNDVALTVEALANNFGASGAVNNTTPIPTPSRQATTTGRRSTSTTGRRASTTATTATTGRKGTSTTGRRSTVTTQMSAASLPFVAPAIQILFLALVSAFLFMMS